MKRCSDCDRQRAKENSDEEGGLLDVDNMTPAPSTSESVQEPRKEKHIPYILDGEFFEIVKNVDRNVSAKCKKCLGAGKLISGTLTSTGNFRSHIKHRHGSLLPLLEKKKINATKSINQAKGSNQGEVKAGGHEDFFIKRKIPKKSNRTVTQQEAMDSITNFIVAEMQPLSTIEKPSFRGMRGLLSQGTIKPLEMPDRKSFLKDLRARHDGMLYSVKKKLKESDYVCTTADMWTGHNRSYLGITGHIINKDTLQRESFVLGIKSFLFRHTHEKIADSLFNVHEEFEISEKITHTVTDNAANFSKAFNVFGPSESEADQEAEMNKLMTDISCESDGDADAGDEDLEPVDVDNILNESEDGESSTILPKQKKCVSHTLNLFTTADLAKISDRKYKKIHTSAFAKCQAFWNLTSRSTNAADTTEELAKKKCPIQANLHSSK